MVTLRRKKNTRCRAGTTHGYGSMKKNRGAGHRGGRGMAGSGKRADTKKPSIIKEFGGSYFGRRGFTTPSCKYPGHVCLNVGELSACIDRYVADKLVEKKGDAYHVDLKKLGFTKLLGRGQVLCKLHVVAPAVSVRAKEKIEKAGGSLVGHETA